MKTHLSLLILLVLAFCNPGANAQAVIYKDKPYLQDYSIKYYSDTSKTNLLQAASDQNGNIQILAKEGVQHVYDGQFLYPGKIVPDNSYRFLKDKKISAVISYENQFTYLTDQVIFSNAWAGTLLSKHSLSGANMLAGGMEQTFLISDGKSLELNKNSENLWSGKLDGDEIIGLAFQSTANQFWILGKKTLYSFSVKDKKLTKQFSGADFTCFDINNKESNVTIGTSDGYLTFNIATKQAGAIHKKLPVTNITTIKEVHGKRWFGTDQGAFSLRADGKFDYYNGERWLPGNKVTDIAAGPKNSVLVLTTKGLGQIVFKSMTLEDKAMLFEEQVRQRHIRNGFNAALVHMDHGNLSTGYMEDSDNDGLGHQTQDQRLMTE